MITNRQAHEEAAEQPLAENFFTFNGIDPDAPFTDGVISEVIKERKRQDVKRACATMSFLMKRGCLLWCRRPPKDHGASPLIGQSFNNEEVTP